MALIDRIRMTSTAALRNRGRNSRRLRDSSPCSPPSRPPATAERTGRRSHVAWTGTDTQPRRHRRDGVTELAPAPARAPGPAPSFLGAGSLPPRQVHRYAASSSSSTTSPRRRSHVPLVDRDVDHRRLRVLVAEQLAQERQVAGAPHERPGEDVAQDVGVAELLGDLRPPAEPLRKVLKQGVREVLPMCV